MKALKLLVLTNHKAHASSNSIYALLNALVGHAACERIDIASSGITANKLFFKYHLESRLMAAPVSDGFQFSENGQAYLQKARWVDVSDYDLILLRMPPPADRLFFEFLTSVFPARRIINNPKGIVETGTKEYLLQHQDLCPPMQYCSTIEEIKAFAARFPIVLKPLNAYGGEGIIRIDGQKVWMGNTLMDFEAFAAHYEQNQQPALAMKFLKNVHRGDKRVVVCNNTIVGASLRKPAKGTWLCNGAQGGQSFKTRITREERHIAAKLGEALLKKGVFMFGFDTLVEDNGKRVLSEINTQSIGGLKQISEQSGPQILNNISNQFWTYAKNIVDEKILIGKP